MNTELEARGRPPSFPTGHMRYLVRRVGIASPRKSEHTTLGRTGLASVSGWFDKSCLDGASSVATELGLTLQILAESGLRRLMRPRSPAK
jgi:hypothetical protein